MRTNDDILVVLGSLMMMDSAMGHQCYVCDSGIPDDLYQLKKTFPLVTSFPACSTFRDTEEDEENFLRVCPKRQQEGCLTKFEADGSIMRTCAPIKVDDCKEANGVTYCYCKGDSCNTLDRKPSTSGDVEGSTDEALKGHSDKHRNHTETPKEHSESDIFENQFLPGYSAPSITKFSADYIDDKDNTDDPEGSGQEYTPFYYYDDEDGPNFPWYQKHNYDYSDVDTEYGDQESPDYSDSTEPPPYIMEETPESPKQENNRGQDVGDIIFEPEDVPPKHVEDTREASNNRGASNSQSYLILLPLYILHMTWLCGL